MSKSSSSISSSPSSSGSSGVSTTLAPHPPDTSGARCSAGREVDGARAARLECPWTSPALSAPLWACTTRGEGRETQTGAEDGMGEVDTNSTTHGDVSQTRHLPGAVTRGAAPAMVLIGGCVMHRASQRFDHGVVDQPMAQDAMVLAPLIQGPTTPRANTHPAVCTAFREALGQHAADPPHRTQYRRSP
jgi:hypothetical protein